MEANLNWNALSAIGSLAAAVAAAVAAVAAVWTTLKNSRHAREFAAVDLWWRIDERFSSPHMLAFRRLAADAILKGDFESPAIDEVLDYFEFIGGLERRGVVDSHMLWHSLFNWVRAYWILCADLVAQAEKNDPDAWADFGRLYQILVALEEQDGRDPYTLEDARKMLESERDALTQISQLT